MSIHIYEDADLTLKVSQGDLSNPDDDTYNGTDGDSKDKQLYLANEQTTLSQSLAPAGTTVHLTEARFSDNQIIVVDEEQMLITSGGGRTTLGVERGYAGTTVTSHESGADVYSGYDYSGLMIEPIDTSGTNEATWYLLALTQLGLDSAIPGGALNLGDKAHDVTIPFWRRCVVPSGTPVQNKTDLKLRLTGTENPIL